MRVVLDTNVLISATQWQGSVAQKLLFKLIRDNIKIFCSTDIISEYQRVLKRDFNYTDYEIAYILEKIFACITLITPIEKINVIRDDPDDNKIVECALAASADYIITYDKHLLNIKEFEGVKIITPNEALRIL